VLNAANVESRLSPDAMAVIYGSGLSDLTVSASGPSLPQILGNTMVMLNGITSPLIFVSPGQINFIVPSTIADGEAQVQVFRTDGTLMATGQVSVGRVAPGIFTMSGDGRGTPLGLTTYDGASYQSLTEDNGNPRALPVSTDKAVAYLILYGTGFRHVSDLKNAEVLIGGVPAPVYYANRQPDYPGLDQMNLSIPESLHGYGEVEVEIKFDGVSANKVKLVIGR
jgi:uncharacterized protein (TIGR03437 family)